MHIKLLNLYFDAKQMTRNDIFNKYQLNNSICSFTKKQNDNLWEIISSSFCKNMSKETSNALKIIVNGSFEKMCNEKIKEPEVIERLVSLLW